MIMIIKLDHYEGKRLIMEWWYVIVLLLVKTIVLMNNQYIVILLIEIRPSILTVLPIKSISSKAMLFIMILIRKSKSLKLVSKNTRGLVNRRRLVSIFRIWRLTRVVIGSRMNSSWIRGMGSGSKYYRIKGLSWAKG